jgi:hypothetical protein
MTYFLKNVGMTRPCILRPLPCTTAVCLPFSLKRKIQFLFNYMKWAGTCRPNKNYLSFLFLVMHTEFFQEKRQPFISIRKKSRRLFGTIDTKFTRSGKFSRTSLLVKAHPTKCPATDYYMKI